MLICLVPCPGRSALLWLALLAFLASANSAAWNPPPSLRITEFMADNETGLTDEDGHFSDWIELHNPGAAPVQLGGFHLTDTPSNPAKWTFPNVTLNPGAYLVVFASGKNRVDPTARLHASFSLSAIGEYLALIAPDGATVIHEFPAYPPQFENESFGLSEPGINGFWSFFPKPTPGAANGESRRAGPIFTALGNPTEQPPAGPLTLTAAMRGINSPVASVNLSYRRMFAPETTIPMSDNGMDGDAAAGDGVWTAVIPAAALAPGEMTRWRFVARDRAGAETKEPAYRAPLDSHQYHGTVARDPNLLTELPVFHWFTANANAAGTGTGSRGAVFYRGELYDNVLFTLHGQSSSSFPKKSYNIDFNRTQRFLWSAGAPRVADIDLLTNWADKSKARHVLAYEIMRESGVAAHFAFTVRVEQNGDFFSTADLVEDADEIYLERAGLNPEGALYKVYSNQLNKDAGNTANSGVEKKTRKFENNNDLQALINGLDLTGPALANYLHDNIDLPRCVNMLAANSVIRNIDMHSKNWYIYRDTTGGGEWAILPWDLDLSHGRVWNTQNTYFDNALYTDGFVVTGTSIRLVSHLFANPAIRAMILRRVRTLTDRFLQPPPAAGTPENSLYYERRLNELSALIDPPGIIPSDARRDFEKWGSWLQGGATVRHTNANAAVETMAEAIQRWKTEYLPARRRHIYNTQIAGKGGEIPLPQTGGNTFTYTPLLTQGAPVKAFVPTNSTLGVRWIGISSFEPFDTSGWITGVTGAGYERGAGYENLLGANLDNFMRNNNSVFLRIEFEAPDPASFDRLELRMKFDDGFVAFLNGAVIASANAPAQVQWNSSATAQHEASAASFDVYDVTARKNSLRPGRNILAIHGLNDSLSSSDMLILPELHAGKLGPPSQLQPALKFGLVEFSPASGNQDEEFIQILNPNSIAVDISDWRITGGVEHAFAPGTVLAPNSALFVCPSAAAFRARAISPKGGEGHFVQGGYEGHLSSRGETLTLLEPSGAANTAVTYQGRPSLAQQYLVISEIMYRPPGDGLAEFIELFNISDTVTLDLKGVRFTSGIQFDFTDSAITSLPPRARAVVIRDATAFALAHPNAAKTRVAGVFANGSSLSNGGEEIKLEGADQGTVVEFRYGDSSPWPSSPDGGGHSLVLVSPLTNPDPALASNWEPSKQLGGSPGEPDGVPFPANPSGDANNNGQPDLVDYALGNDLGLPPIFPAFKLSTTNPGLPDALLLTYPISLGADRAGIDVFFSTNLVHWTDGAPHLVSVSTAPLGDGRALVTRRVKSPLRDEPRLFMQMRVTAH